LRIIAFEVVGNLKSIFKCNTSIPTACWRLTTNPAIHYKGIAFSLLYIVQLVCVP